MKIQIPILTRFGKLCFQWERDDFVTIRDIIKYTDLVMIIPNLGDEVHFQILNKHRKKSKFRFRD